MFSLSADPMCGGLAGWTMIACTMSSFELVQDKYDSYSHRSEFNG